MFASHPSRTEVVDLPSAGLPADHGLASLGLVMQLAGRTTGVLAALIASLALVNTRVHHAWGWASRAPFWFWFAIALCFARSQLHRVAGRDLIYGRRSADGATADPFHAMRSYVIFGLGHAAVLGVIAARVFDAPGRAAAGIAAALAVWPGVLAWVCRLPRFHALRAGIPLAEDRGLEGASIVMTVLGAYGVVSTSAIVAMLGALSAHQLRHGWGVMLVLMFVLLLVRSSLHVRAGLAGLRDHSFDRPSELAAHYATFGVVSAFCVGGALALLAMSERLTPEAIVSVAVMCWLLVTWPMIVKRFFHQRQFAELLAGDRMIHRRAPDAGLTGLGWLLAGHGALCAALLIVQAAVGVELGRLSGAIHNPAPVRLAAALGWSGDSRLGLYLGAAVLALELAAAAALIQMSDRRRAIATIYALACAGAVLVLHAPTVRALGARPDLSTAVQLLPLVFQLVLPAAALRLVHRVVVPTARARYRPAAGDTGQVA